MGTMMLRRYPIGKKKNRKSMCSLLNVVLQVISSLEFIGMFVGLLG